MEHKDGGLAFPALTYSKEQTGMSLRDWLAGMALMGYRSAWGEWYRIRDVTTQTFADPEAVARWSYTDADAMLKERLK